MAIDVDVVFGELRGFLEAFARLNDKTDHGCTFTFDRLPLATTVSQAMELFFRGEAKTFKVTPIADWPQTVRRICQLWLFQFQVTGMAHLVDRRKDFSLSYDWGRERILDWIMEPLEKMVRPSAVWKVEVETKSHYECGWDDVAFETDEASFLLHLHKRARFCCTNPTRKRGTCQSLAYASGWCSRIAHSDLGVSD